MKNIIILIILFLIVFAAGNAGITQSPGKEITTGPLNVELFMFPGNCYIGEIALSKIEPVKNTARKKDYNVNYNIGFDVDAIITVADKENDNLSIINPVRKNNTIEILSRNDDPEFVFLCRRPPEYLFVVSGYDRKYVVPIQTTINNKANNSFQKKYYSALLREIKNRRYGEFDDELLYRLRVIGNRAGVSEHIDVDRAWRRSGSGALLEMIELTSGAIAMEGSLQLSVMRDVSSAKTQPKSINISTLASPELKPHDFKKMLGGQKINTAEIDKFAPLDSVYCRFSKISFLFKSLDIAKLIQEEIPVLTKFIDWKDDNQSRLLTKLGLKINPNLKKFYGLAVEEVAVAMADPYLIEGADMAVIFHLNNKTLFAYQINKYREAFLKEIKNAKEERLTYNNTEITALTSADNSLSSYCFFDGNYAVIATSAWMAKKCIDAKSGKAKSAADNLDFQYLMKQHNGPGDAFVYIGDDFVSRIVSASFKIGELRRVNCEANMKILKYARRLYSLENGGHEANMNDLLSGGYITNMPVCPSDGSYEIELQNPACSKHGPLGHLRTLSGNTVDLVSSHEAEKYKSFVDNYHNYWRKYIDPIGIRLDFGDTISMRTIILPLIEHPDYIAIQDLFGGSPISLESLTMGNSKVIFHAAVKLKVFDNYKSDLSHLSDQRLRGLTFGAREEFRANNPDFRGDPLAWIGNEADLFILDEASMLQDMIDRRRSFGEMALVNLAALRIKVRDHGLAKQVLPAVMELLHLNLSVPEMKYGGELWKTRANRMPVNILLREDGLWITPFEPNLARLTQSSSVYANKSGSEGDKVTSLRDVTGIKNNKANFEIGIHTQNINELKGTVNLMTHAVYRDYCGDNIRHLNLLVDLHEPFARLRGHLENNSVLNYNTGYTAHCPAGGKYTHSNQYYKCSFHDEPDDKMPSGDLLDKYINAETNLSKVLFKLKSIVIDLGFTEEGLETRIFIRDPLK